MQTYKEAYMKGATDVLNSLIESFSSLERSGIKNTSLENVIKMIEDCKNSTLKYGEDNEG